MLHIVVATNNRHKFRELKALLRVRGIRWHSLAEFPHVKPARENGRTFETNAIKKARAVARATGHLALADDSGIEVDALGGAPGVRSARFAGAHGNDGANNRKLLRLMQRVPLPARTARYVCVLALCDARRELAITEGAWKVRVATAPAGHGGFGYDPVMVAPRLRRTVAQLPASMKQRLSHRAMAARRMQSLLRRRVARAR